MGLHWLLLQKHIFTPNPTESISWLNRVNDIESVAILAHLEWGSVHQGRESNPGGHQLPLAACSPGGREGGKEARKGMDMRMKKWQRTSKEAVSVWKSRKLAVEKWRHCLPEAPGLRVDSSSYYETLWKLSLSLGMEFPILNLWI